MAIIQNKWVYQEKSKSASKDKATTKQPAIKPTTKRHTQPARSSLIKTLRGGMR